jgi:hypothetical protein
MKFGRRVYNSLQTLYLIQQVLSLRSLSFKKLDYTLLRGVISEMVWTKTKKKHDLHPRFGPGSVPTFVINTAAAGLLNLSALIRDEKSPYFCGLFYSQGNKSLVPGGQNIYERGDKASSTILKRLDLCPSGPESTSTTELKKWSYF